MGTKLHNVPVRDPCNLSLPHIPFTKHMGVHSHSHARTHKFHHSSLLSAPCYQEENWELRRPVRTFASFVRLENADAFADLFDHDRLRMLGEYFGAVLLQVCVALLDSFDLEPFRYLAPLEWSPSKNTPIFSQVHSSC